MRFMRPREPVSPAAAPVLHPPAARKSLPGLIASKPFLMASGVSEEIHSRLMGFPVYVVGKEVRADSATHLRNDR